MSHAPDASLYWSGTWSQLVRHRSVWSIFCQPRFSGPTPLTRLREAIVHSTMLSLASTAYFLAFLASVYATAIFGGVPWAMLTCFVAYFGTDLLVALRHFLIDNFQPDDNG